MNACENCGSKNWYAKKWVNGQEFCSECSDANGSGVNVDDVYFRSPFFHEHLVDEGNPSTWDHGTYVESRRHLKNEMKRLRVSEAGDRIHGARASDARRKYFC